MMPGNGAPDFDQLEHVIEALDRGHWRRASETLRRGADAEGQEAVVGMIFSLRCVCRCQWLQCAFGDGERARDELERATARLVRLGPVAGTVRGGRLQLLAEPPRELPLAHLLWGTIRVLMREQADLDAVRLIFEDIRRGRSELIYACVEYLTWVEFDPFTARVHPWDQDLLGLDDDAYARFRTVNRQDVSARATNLRHLAAVRTGSVSKRTWARLGGSPAVREAALLTLASEPVTRGRTDCPVRLGRVRAWEYAQRLADDTPA